VGVHASVPLRMPFDHYDAYNHYASNVSAYFRPVYTRIESKCRVKHHYLSSDSVLGLYPKRNQNLNKG